MKSNASWLFISLGALYNRSLESGILLDMSTPIRHHQPQICCVKSVGTNHKFPQNVNAGRAGLTLTAIGKKHRVT
jgi:hypothetical protein